MRQHSNGLDIHFRTISRRYVKIKLRLSRVKVMLIPSALKYPAIRICLILPIFYKPRKAQKRWSFRALLGSVGRVCRAGAGTEPACCKLAGDGGDDRGD